MDPTILHARAMQEFDAADRERDRDALRTARGIMNGCTLAGALWIIGGVAVFAIKGLIA